MNGGKIMGTCRVCKEPTEGINALCYQCQLDLLRDWLNGPKTRNMIALLADTYLINRSTVMNILRQFKVI